MAPTTSSLVKNGSYFLSGGGEMGGHIRSFDWSKTSVGPIETWPQSLRTMLSVVLNSKFPMLLYWGADLVCIYNDAFRPSLGNDGKHPGSLGKPGSEFLPEAWYELGPVLAAVIAGGEATWNEDQLIPIYRNGKIENVYWTYSFSPVFDESGAPGGVLATCFESTENVLTMARLEESTDALSFAIEATELATWDVNPLTNTLKGNNRLKEWFGLSAEGEIELQVALDVIAEKDRKRVTEAIKRVNQYSSGGEYDIEYIIIHPLTKEERFVRAKGRAWFNDKKETYRFNGTLQDITKKVIVIKQLEESEARFRNMLEQAPVAIALTRGQDFSVESINAPMLRIIGQETREDVVGKKLMVLLPEIKSQPILQVLQHVLETGESYRGNEVPITFKSGERQEERYLDLSYTPLVEVGEVTGIIHVAVDVTEQVVARKKIEESEQHVRSLIESAPFPICVCVGEEMKIQFANQAMFDTWGKGNDVMGRLYSEILPELENQQIFDQLNRVYTTGISFYKNNQQVDLFVDGSIESSYFTYSFVPLFDGSGSVYGVMQIAADVTDLNQARQQLEEREKEAQDLAEELAASNEELRASSDYVQESNELLSSSNLQLSRINADMDNFIYTASHDLRAPISNIEGLMYAILEDLSVDSREDPVIKKLFRLLAASIERFKRTIFDLTEITKLQRQDINRKDNQVDLSHVLKEVQLDLSAEVRQANAQIEIDLQACELVNLSPKNSRSIVYNLLSNALKYCSSERQLLIQIRCYRQGNYQVLSVQDNGLGMDTSDESKVFGMFKRLHDHVEGTGVGLYIVKKIIESAGGRIEVESKVDEGATFRVYFRQANPVLHK